MGTEVLFSRKAKKAYNRLSDDAKALVDLLVQDLEETEGNPNGRGWNNCGDVKQRGKNAKHCHLSRKKPELVACWNVEKRKEGKVFLCIVKVDYIGTREGAPY